MTRSSKRLILASNSPRRQELLKGLDLEFTIDTRNNFREDMNLDVSAEQIPLIMAQGKSHGFHRELEEDEVLITSDTVVIVPEKHSVLGKPHSREEAVEMLRLLSGRTHKVVTAVTIRDSRSEESFSDETLVTFEQLSDAEIDYYLDKYRPYDKAGAYGVQEWIGYVAISRLEGSFYNVMGFPVHRVYRELRKFL